MKLVKGETIGEAISRFHTDSCIPPPSSRSLEFQKLLGVFVSICRTIEYAHAHNVIHRDLKPQNIILGKYGETIVLDWGLAKVFQPDEESAQPDVASVIIRDWGADQTQPGSVQGTPAYMSPEQADGHTALVSPRTDIYALGVILYQILTGVLPFEGDSAMEVLQRVREGDFSPPRSVKHVVPKPLEAACLKAMARQPEDRYGLVQDLREDIERYLADEPTSVLRESWGTSVLRWCRHHKSVVAGVFALLVTAVVALSVSTVVINHERIAKQRAIDLADREPRRRLEIKVIRCSPPIRSPCRSCFKNSGRKSRWYCPGYRSCGKPDLSARERLRVDLALIRSEPSLCRSIQETHVEVAGLKRSAPYARRWLCVGSGRLKTAWEIARNERQDDAVRLRAGVLWRYSILPVPTGRVGESMSRRLSRPRIPRRSPTGSMRSAQSAPY